MIEDDLEPIASPWKEPFPYTAGGYGTIIVDPPWQYGNTATRANAQGHYPTLPDWAMFTLPVGSLAAPKAHLYLWTTAAHLQVALPLIGAWGFDFKMPLVWVKANAGKLQIGLGNYFRHAHELCLFATRGTAKARVHNLPSVFWAARSEHSRKPDVIHEWSEQLSPGPYLELFARRGRPGWNSWGHLHENTPTGTGNDTEQTGDV